MAPPTTIRHPNEQLLNDLSQLYYSVSFKYIYSVSFKYIYSVSFKYI